MVVVVARHSQVRLSTIASETCARVRYVVSAVKCVCVFRYILDNQNFK